jgi:PAS domain S-box-containing protein
VDRRRIPLIVVVAYLLVTATAGWVLQGQPLARAVLGHVTLISSAALVVSVVWRRRRSWSGTQRLFWDILAIGIGLWIVGHIGWAFEDLVLGEQSWVQWHTVFSLLGTIAPLIALLARPHLGVRGHAVAPTAADVAAFGLLAVFIYCYFVLVPSLVPGAELRAERTLLALVQVNRGLLLGGLLATLWFARATEWRPTYVRLAVGVAIGFVLRIGANLAIARGEYQPGSLHDLAWIVPLLFYAWAALDAPSSPLEEHRLEFREPSSSVAFSAVPVLLIPTIGYGMLTLDSLAAPADSFRTLLTSVATVGGLALLTLRLSTQRLELQRADARLKLLAAATEQTVDHILITRADGTFEHANEAFLHATGYSRPELTRLEWQTLLSGDFERLTEEVRRSVAEHGIWRGTLLRRCKDGSTFPVFSSVSSLRQDGAITHYVVVERDVSEELRLRDQLVHSERLSAIGELVAGVAHEINNPLQTIVGSVELMLDHRTGGVTTRDLELVRQEAGRAGQIVRNLLSFVRRGAPDRVVSDLTAMVRSTVQLREYHLLQANIAVDARYAPEPLTIFANLDEIRQVVLNLLLNAEHALMRAGRAGTIFVTTTTEGSRHVVEISDSGPGIPPELRGRIFEPFFTTKEVGEGTGLGLSISHGIASAHGGSLELRDSEVGARFRLTLPVYREPSSALPESQIGSASGDRTILVVDDEAPIRRLLTRLLERRGFEVHEAETGEQALDHAAARRYGLVICDVRMPGIGGLELYRQLVAKDPELGRRFVFITGDTGSLGSSSIDTADASVLAKPFTAADLDAVLNRIVSRETS